MDDGKIKYEDLVSPDDSIKVLIQQLNELNGAYGATLEAIKAGAKEIVTQLKDLSVSTGKERTELDEVTLASSRLARAQKELKFAMSDVGQQVAWLKSQTAAQNKLSSEQQRHAQALAGSYDSIKLQIRDLTARYKELSAADRAGERGNNLLGQLLSKKQQLAELDKQMKLHVQTLSAVEKAEQKLAFLRSAEGKRLMELKQLIADEIAANKTQKATIDEVAQAQKRLNEARSASRIAANELNIQAKEANRVAKLQAQLNLSAEGSYNRLAAQYELNKIELNKMSAAERQSELSGKALERETLELYIKMQKLQEATGNHRLSVGNYAKSWDGLGISVSQVVRELPAAAVSMNTFFLGISNNIPILMDEINKLRAENKELIAQGKQAKSVVGSIAKALFSFNTLMVVGLTVLSMHGKAIINWVNAAFKGKAAAISYKDALKNITEELETTNDSYGKNIITVKRLSEEWKKLSSQKEQLQWIRDNKTEFDQLDISIRNVTDAENAFVDNTDVITNALKARAKAAAAMKLAADKYEEALIKEAEIEVESAKGPNWKDKFFAGAAQAGAAQSGLRAGNFQGIAEANRKTRIQSLIDEKNAAEATADQYFEMAKAITEASDAELKAVGIERSHKYKKEKEKHSRERHPRQRDLTDQIWRNDLSIRKKYELSISALQRDEYQKRRIETIDATNATIREMQEKFRKNQEFLANKDGRFKPLTPEQKKQITEQQNEITAIIENERRKLAIDLQKIDDEQAVESMKKLREMMDNRLGIITDDIEKEKQLRLQQLEDLEAHYTTKAQVSSGNEVEVTAERRTPEQIAEFHRQRMIIEAEYDAIIYRLRQQSIDNEIELVKKGTIEELDLLLQRNEAARAIALAENRLKPASERQDEGQINAIFDKNRRTIYGNNRMSNFDQAQKTAEAEFNIVKHNETQITIFKLQQERDRWKKQIQLAKEGALDWSDAQLKEAEAMIKKLNREIEEAESFAGLIGKKGFGGALLTKLGFDDDQIEALTEAVNIVLDNIKAIADAEVEAAEKAVEAAEKRVDAAQRAYDAEIEARNNGYANNVATAKKELQQEQRNQAQKQKLLEEAQRRQEAINTVIQASSLITASANLWSAFSSVPIIGPALAIAAIAAMWGSFALAKIRAAQITKASQEYGEGGLEFLEGGSHASGNDIDLQTKNSKGKNMRAEGGEALAIINKRSTRKYRKLLPQIVDNINKGTFEDKFIKAFDAGERISQSIIYSQNVDLSQLENDVKALKRNSEYQCYIMPDGSCIEKKNNVTRRIH